MDALTAKLYQRLYGGVMPGMAAGQGGDPDIFSAELYQRFRQGWVNAVPVPVPDEGDDGD